MGKKNKKTAKAADGSAHYLKSIEGRAPHKDGLSFTRRKEAFTGKNEAHANTHTHTNTGKTGVRHSIQYLPNDQSHRARFWEV